MLDEIKENALPVQIGFTFMVANPQDSLRNAIMRFGSPSVGYGFGITAAYNFDPVPIVLGGEFAMQFYGGTEKTFYQMSGPFRDTLVYSTSNLQLPITIHARIQPDLFNWIFPYVEADVGMMVFSSSLDVTRNPNTESPSVNNDTESSVSWLYGGGAGVMVKFADIITLPNTLQRWLLDVRFRYLWGTDVDVPSITFDEGQNVVRTNARVNDPSFVFFNIGLALQF